MTTKTPEALLDEALLVADDIQARLSNLFEAAEAQLSRSLHAANVDRAERFESASQEIANLRRRVQELEGQIELDGQLEAIGAAARATELVPVGWAISYDGKTPYALWTEGDGALLDLEVKRQGGTACKMELYARVEK